jgi:membrane protease YdiL (CAAX protease family)
MRKGKKAIASILAVWFCANFIPHLIVFLATGKVYYQLAPLWQIVAESSIMSLNLLLPLIALRYSSHQEGYILQSLGWRWGRWRTIWIGLLGFVAFMIAAIGTQLIGQPISSPPQRLTSQELILMLILLLGLTAAAEETMFRGYIQTTLTQEYGTWIGIGGAALLFGLRHLPMDLYNGLVQHAAPTAWISRLLQLYIGALLFGMVRYRAKSTWASWVMHESVLILIVVLGLIASG